MIRGRTLAALLALWLAAPSFGGPAERVADQGAAPSVAPVPALPALGVPAAASWSPVAPVPSFAPAAAPAAQALPASAAAISAVPAPIAPAAPVAPSSAHDARGPPSSSAVSARVRSETRSWQAPVEDILKDHDVLLIGESHANLDSIGVLAREMPRLARAGVRAVGIEGLKRPHQAAVDEYVAGRTDALPAEALSFSPARRGVLEDLLKAARANRVRVVALGLPLDHWASQVAELAARRTDDPVESFGTDFKAQQDRAVRRYEHGFNEAVAEVTLTRRNQVMAESIRPELAGGGKAVIVAGRDHVPGPDRVLLPALHVRGDYGDLAREFAQTAVRAYSRVITGGSYVSPEAAEDDAAVSPNARAVAHYASPDGTPAFVPMSSDQGLWHAGEIR